MSRAGFDVTGVEFGDSTVEFVRRRFDLDIRRGPIEEADLEDKFDAIVMIDVLEHLHAPLETLSACTDHLDNDGALIIQTPCYREEGTDSERMTSQAIPTGELMSSVTSRSRCAAAGRRSASTFVFGTFPMLPVGRATHPRGLACGPTGHPTNIPTIVVSAATGGPWVPCIGAPDAFTG
jgi:2-polyprenyl-3-methyl-5-hydroxy-6-metoxy-1,4-benzoquinol methylase